MQFSSYTFTSVLAAILFTTATHAQTACNNSPLLCDRSYSNISHLGAHNSPFLRSPETGFSLSGNQYFNSTAQLSAGVRLLTAQVHNNNGTWSLCHSSCLLLNAGTLRSWLASIGTWLAANPNEVVTVLLVNSDAASASDLRTEYAAAGVEGISYRPASLSTRPTAWPTLREMIANGTRLVNFVADLPAARNTVAPYLMDEFGFVFETTYNNIQPAQLNNCTIDRPTTFASATAALQGGMLPLVNHFLYNTTNLFGSTIQMPDEAAINVTNAASGGLGNLGTHADTCTSVYGRKPTFFLVDFTSAGPAIDAIDRLNGVTNATGRSAMSTTTSGTASSGGARSQPALAALLVVLLVFVTR